MRLQWLGAAAVASLQWQAVRAEDDVVENKSQHRQICAGVFSKEDKPGPYNPSIELEFDASDSGDVTVVVFSYKDIGLLGVPVSSNGREVTKYVCDDSAIAAELCSQSQYGTVLIKTYNGEPQDQILSEKVSLPSKPILYNVTDTNYYCVVTFPLSDPTMKYRANVHFMNAYGHLPASQLPLLWFHLAMAFAYALTFGLWMMLYFRYRHDILPVQKYITGLLGFMVVEQLIVWGYYVNYNKVEIGSSGMKVYLGLVAILGAARLSMTFFLLLIVCLGYSVVFPSLGKQMKWCWILAGAQFVSGAFYSLDSYSLMPADDEGLISLILFTPLTITMSVFYVWTLQGMEKTMKYLMERKQIVKARMYRLLWWILLGSAFAVLAFLVIHALVSSLETAQDFINNYWKYKWVLSDGWPNFVYFVAFSLIAGLWAPTDNNRRYAMSTQLAQNEDDAEEFEIGSLNGSDEEEDNSPPPYPPSQQGGRAQAQNQQRSTMFNADDRDAEELSDFDNEDSSWARESENTAENSGQRRKKSQNQSQESDDELVESRGGRF